MPKATNNLIILVSGYRVRQNSIGKSAKLWEHFENDRRSNTWISRSFLRYGWKVCFNKLLEWKMLLRDTMRKSNDSSGYDKLAQNHFALYDRFDRWERCRTQGFSEISPRPRRRSPLSPCFRNLITCLTLSGGTWRRSGWQQKMSENWWIALERMFVPNWRGP